MTNYICEECGKLVGRTPTCPSCKASGRKVAWAHEFTTPGSKSTLGLQAMQAFIKRGGEVLYVNLEQSLNHELTP